MKRAGIVIAASAALSIAALSAVIDAKQSLAFDKTSIFVNCGEGVAGDIIPLVTRS